MLKVLEWLKQEWSVVKAAPVVCLLCFACGAIAAAVFYAERMAVLGQEISGLTQQVSFWKDKATAPKVPEAKLTVESLPPVQKETPPVTKKAKATHPSTPSEPSTPKPAPTATNINNCPNGICISGGSATNPTVVNNGPPEPKLTWDQTQSTDDKNGPITTLIMSLDRSMEIAAFGAVCDKPCKTVSFRPMLPAILSGNDAPLSIKENPNFVGYVLGWPRPLGAGVRVRWVIQAVDGSPVTIQQVGKIAANQLPPEAIR